MKTEFGVGKFRWVCSFIYAHVNNALFQKFIFPLLTTVPAVLIVQVVKMNDVWQTSNDISAFWKGISGLIAEYVIVVHHFGLRMALC
ncbi:MAG: hypothetical protein IPG06_08090 [Haliea sp.]|nr:hypothetical protein [Haliea sp.]